MDIEVPLINNVNSPDDYLTEGILLDKMMCRGETPKNYGAWGLSLLSDNTKDFSKYKTYDFEYTSVENPLLEKKIFAEFGKQLDELGLSRNQENPDLLIIMNYYSGKKEQYTPPQQITSTRIAKSYNWYWGYIPVSITESKTIDGQTKVTYLLSLNIKMLEADEIKTSKLPPVVWQASISKTSDEELIINNECAGYFEICLYQFPIVWDEVPGTMHYPYYKYTGIIYNKKDIRTVFDVVPGSPADKSGLKKGDKILVVGEDKLPSKYEDFVTDELYWPVISDPVTWTTYPNYIKRVNKIGSGFRYLLCNSDTEIQAISFNITRDGKNMNLMILPIKKRFIHIYY